MANIHDLYTYLEVNHKVILAHTHPWFSDSSGIYGEENTMNLKQVE